MTAHLTIVREHPPPVTHPRSVRRPAPRQTILLGSGRQQVRWLVVDGPSEGAAAKITMSRRRPVATRRRQLLIRFPLDMAAGMDLAESSSSSRPFGWLLAHEPAGLELVLLLRRAAPDLRSTLAAASLLVGLVVEAWQVAPVPRGP